MRTLRLVSGTWAKESAPASIAVRKNAKNSKTGTNLFGNVLDVGRVEV
jgi:hypothetical protein